MAQQPDTSFLQDLKNRRSSAFDRLYEEFYRPLCYFAEGFVNNGALAEDIATECMIKLLRHTTEFDTVIQLKTYLYTSVRNACIDHVRAQQRHHRSHEELSYLNALNSEDTERRIIRAEILQSIYAAIETLPERNKTIVQMALLEGKTNEEIAAALNVADQTIRNRKSEGMNLLRSILRDRYGLSSVAIATGLAYFY